MRVFFDGQGGFSYGQESSFSSGAGLAYVLRRWCQQRTLPVENNRVVLTFATAVQGGNVYNGSER